MFGIKETLTRYFIELSTFVPCSNLIPMLLSLLFYVYLLLCAITFLDVLVRFKQKGLLKTCLLLIIVSLFIMNYFAYAGIKNQVQFMLVRFTRALYVCSTMLAVVRLATPKIPRWIIAFSVAGFSFAIGVRLFYFKQIDIKNHALLSNQVFSIGTEFYTPNYLVRCVIFALVIIIVSITYHYYHLFLVKLDMESPNSKKLARWVMCMVIPFFLLAIFGVLGNLNFFGATTSFYLFSFFSWIIAFSILLRPALINTGPAY